MIVTFSCPHCQQLHQQVDTRQSFTAGGMFVCTGCNRQIKPALPDTRSYNLDPPQQVVLTEDMILGELLDGNQSYPLRAGQNRIGREVVSGEKDHRIVLPEKYISRLHCIIEIKTNSKGVIEFQLSDQESRNGTYFITGKNEQRLLKDEMFLLRNGDRIKLASKILELRIEKDLVAAIEKYRRRGDTRIIW